VHNANAVAAGDLQRRVEEARTRGYARRHPLYRGGSFNGKPRDDALDAIAVPLVHAGWVFGALNINWNRAAMSEREMVKRHLPALRAAAHGIAAAAAQQGLPQALAEVGQAERCG
jgi:IclR family mhp operon transcriptional activator